MLHDGVKCANCGETQVERKPYYKRAILGDFIQVSRTIELNLGDHGERQLIWSHVFCTPACASEYLIAQVEVTDGDD